jgi:hypothetical protein
MLRELDSDRTAKYAAFEDHSLAKYQEEIYERGVAFARQAIAMTLPVAGGASVGS